jgi:cell division protein FtsA
LDGQRATLSPWGQAASHLSLKASVVYAKRDVYDALWRCKETLTVGSAQLKRRPLPLRDVTDDVRVLASSVLTPQEREEITTVIDMGAEVTKVVIFDHGRPIYTYCDFKGGRHLSRALQKDLHLDSFHEAERIKVESGSLSSDPNAPRVRMRSGGQVKFKQQSTLSRHLERAIKQQLSALRVRLQQDQVWSYVQRGVILTGGGAQLKGLASQAESVLQSPVRVGAPTQEGVCDLVYGPHYATLNGLVNAGLTGYYDAWFACWARPLTQVPPPHHVERPKRTAQRRALWLSKLKRHLSPLPSPNDQPH